MYWEFTKQISLLTYFHYGPRYRVGNKNGQCGQDWLCIGHFKGTSNSIQLENTYTTGISKTIGTVTHFLLFWLCTPALWIWNCTMPRLVELLTVSLNCFNFNPYRVNRLSSRFFFYIVHPKYWDKFTYVY